MKNTISGTKNISLSRSSELSSIDELGLFGPGKRTRSLGRSKPPACIIYTRHVDPVFELGTPYHGKLGSLSVILARKLGFCTTWKSFFVTSKIIGFIIQVYTPRISQISLINHYSSAIQIPGDIEDWDTF